MLGAPIGTTSFIQDFIGNRASKFTDLLRKSENLHDPQMQLLLLRCCLGAPTLTFWLRTTSSPIIEDQIQTYDSAVDRLLLHIFGDSLSRRARELVSLPLSIPKAADIADIAFVSSRGSSWPLQPQNYPRIGFQDAAERLAATDIGIISLPPKASSASTPRITSTKEFKQASLLTKRYQLLHATIIEESSPETKIIKSQSG